MVVSATRLPTPVAQVASSVTVITGADIEQRQDRSLPDVLREVPGLNIVQTGGAGGQTSIFMRGTNPNHTKVLLDGIDISDPSTPSGAPTSPSCWRATWRGGSACAGLRARYTAPMPSAASSTW